MFPFLLFFWRFYYEDKIIKKKCVEKQSFLGCISSIENREKKPYIRTVHSVDIGTLQI